MRLLQRCHTVTFFTDYRPTMAQCNLKVGCSSPPPEHMAVCVALPSSHPYYYYYPSRTSGYLRDSQVLAIMNLERAATLSR